MENPYFFLPFLILLLWAFTDILSAFLVRNLGSKNANLVSRGATLFFSILATILFSREAPKFTWEFLGLVLLDSVLSALAWISYFRGIAAGKLSITQPLAALWAVPTILLSVLFLGEKFSFPGLLLSLVGLFLVSFPAKGGFGLGKDAQFGILAMLLWGLGQFVLKFAVDLGGPFYTTVFIGIFQLSIMGFLLRNEKSPPPKQDKRAPRKVILGTAFLIGVFNSAGFILYNTAISKVGSSLTAAITSASPVAVVLLSFLVLKEKITFRQFLGVLFAALGLVVLSAF